LGRRKSQFATSEQDGYGEASKCLTDPRRLMRVMHYSCIMRTTLALDDRILAEAKARAHEAGVTLGAYVEEALRRDLARAHAPRGPVRLTVSSATGGARPGVDLSNNRALYDAMGTDVA